MGSGTARTNLIFHHGVTDVVDQAAKFIQIPCAVQESCDFASLPQRDEVLKNIIQFPVESYTSDRPSTWMSIGLPFEGRPPLFLLDLALGNRRAQRFCQPFNSGYQRFYRLVTRHSLLERL